MLKLLAEWFWTDRWMGSSGFLLPMEARGVYREMLTQAWRRGARLPNDHEAIQRAIGATKKEWERAWPKIEKFWRVDGDSLVSETQLEVYTEAQEGQRQASERGKKGAQARAQARTQALTQAAAQAAREHKPPSPSSETSSPQGQPPPNGRSRRPIYKGNRLVIFDWQLEDLMQMLGTFADSFHLDLWFDTLDKRALASGEVMPKRDGGRWLMQETLAEVRRRGLPIAGENSHDPYVDLPHAWTCRQCGQVHEGTREQARAGACLSPSPEKVGA